LDEFGILSVEPSFSWQKGGWQLTKFDSIIIGGGQAGLAIGYYLKQQGVHFAILDSCNRTGDSWRNRYDSLTLFTPRMYDGLPGSTFQGSSNGLPSKDEAANYYQRSKRII
jgi:putative flavoprotein involved in K+ transport